MISIFNPIKLLEDIFNEKYPNKECEVCFVTELHSKIGAWGATTFPPDGGNPIVDLEADIPFIGLIDVLAHELSHVVVGTNESDDHGPEWEAVYTILNKEFNKRAEEMGMKES